jgi:hypothetical protein
MTVGVMSGAAGGPSTFEGSALDSSSSFLVLSDDSIAVATASELWLGEDCLDGTCGGD